MPGVLRVGIPLLASVLFTVQSVAFIRGRPRSRDEVRERELRADELGLRGKSRAGTTRAGSWTFGVMSAVAALLFLAIMIGQTAEVAHGR